MSPKTEEEILKKLKQIESLLVKIVPQKTELTEDDVLEILAEGQKEYKEGKTQVLSSLKDLR